MVNRPTFIDAVYRVLTGIDPARDASARDVMETVVARWDPLVLTASEQVRQCALIAICQIGMRWHPSDRYSYSFDDLCQKAVEIAPEFKEFGMTAKTMRSILDRNHLTARHR